LIHLTISFITSVYIIIITGNTGFVK